MKKVIKSLTQFFKFAFGGCDDENDPEETWHDPIIGGGAKRWRLTKPAFAQYTLGRTHWSHWAAHTGQNTLVSTHWAEHTGQNTLGSTHWAEYTGHTSQYTLQHTLGRIHWAEYTGHTGQHTLGRIQARGTVCYNRNIVQAVGGYHTYWLDLLGVTRLCPRLALTRTFHDSNQEVMMMVEKEIGHFLHKLTFSMWWYTWKIIDVVVLLWYCCGGTVERFEVDDDSRYWSGVTKVQWSTITV